jgi:hypothetical protein
MGLKTITHEKGWGPTNPDNLEYRVNQVIESINQRSKGYSTNSFLLPLGCDFTYSSPNDIIILNSLIPVIQEIKSHYKIKIQFSLLSEYFSNLTISRHLEFQNDFNPYSDNPNDYWSVF